MCLSLSLDLIDRVVNVGFTALNVVYMIWSCLINNDTKQQINYEKINNFTLTTLVEQDLNDYIHNSSEIIDQLNFFKQFIKYSDSIFVPVRIVLLILVNFLCCKGKLCETVTTQRIKSTDENQV